MAGITLGVLLDSLGPQVVRPLALPDGRDRLVGAPVIHHPEEPLEDVDGAILLVTGRPAADLLSRAAEAGVSVAVVKCGAADPAPLIEAASDAGIALLSTGPRVAWGQLYTLVDMLLTMVGPAGDPDGLRAADLHALANDIASRVGGAVAIEDLAMRVLAYSTIPGQPIDDMRRDGILGRRVPEHPSNPEWYAEVLCAEGATWMYEPREFYPRLAIAIRVRGEALGTIWALEAEQPLRADAAEVLVEGARMAAPHLARFSLAADEARRRRDEQFRWLLRGLGRTEELAASFGLRADGPFTVIAVGRQAGVPDSLAATHVGGLLRVGFSAYRLRTAAGADDSLAYAVVGMNSAAPLLQRITSDVLTQATERLGPGWLAGISRTVPFLAQVPGGVRQAEEALRALQGPFSQADLGRHADLSAPLFLMGVHSVMRRSPVLDGEPLSLVVEHDSRHGSHYVETLACWLAANYDVPRAADTLLLHPNTLRYRLRRIAELVDIDDPDLRLVLALQLRLREISTTPEA